MVEEVAHQYGCVGELEFLDATDVVRTVGAAASQIHNDQRSVTLFGNTVICSGATEFGGIIATLSVDAVIPAATIEHVDTRSADQPVSTAAADQAVAAIATLENVGTGGTGDVEALEIGRRKFPRAIVAKVDAEIGIAARPAQRDIGYRLAARQHPSRIVSGQAVVAAAAVDLPELDTYHDSVIAAAQRAGKILDPGPAGTGTLTGEQVESKPAAGIGQIEIDPVNTTAAFDRVTKADALDRIIAAAAIEHVDTRSADQPVSTAAADQAVAAVATLESVGTGGTGDVEALEIGRRKFPRAIVAKVDAEIGIAARPAQRDIGYRLAARQHPSRIVSGQAVVAAAAVDLPELDTYHDSVIAAAQRAGKILNSGPAGSGTLTGQQVDVQAAGHPAQIEIDPVNTTAAFDRVTKADALDRNHCRCRHRARRYPLRRSAGQHRRRRSGGCRRRHPGECRHRRYR